MNSFFIVFIVAKEFFWFIVFFFIVGFGVICCWGNVFFCFFRFSGFCHLSNRIKIRIVIFKFTEGHDLSCRRRTVKVWNNFPFFKRFDFYNIACWCIWQVKNTKVIFVSPKSCNRVRNSRCICKGCFVWIWCNCKNFKTSAVVAAEVQRAVFVERRGRRVCNKIVICVIYNFVFFCCHVCKGNAGTVIF